MLIIYLYLWLLPPAILTWVAPLVGRGGMPGITMQLAEPLNIGVALPLLLPRLGISRILGFQSRPAGVSIGRRSC
jgi:hypothetical protein